MLDVQFGIQQKSQQGHHSVNLHESTSSTISVCFSHAAVGGNPVYQLGRLNRCNWWGYFHFLISMGAVLSLATV